ncbi:MAG TPA: tRNA 2-selenouridine(34) synthase MnmH, partial [Burkholderiales bacterium]
PGAHNCPVLDDAERARVGTIYKQRSPFEARRIGAALVAKNVARHLETHFSARGQDWKPLVYCWRGGKRSGSMVHVLREVGWDAVALAGGYQSYRRAVVAQLEVLPARFDFRVICAPTGSGKTRMLEKLAALGAQALDLERLAKHRGSVLGDLPGDAQPSQRMFESLIWSALRHFDAVRPIFVEAESKRIGALRVPEALLARMRASDCVRIDVPIVERVRFLIDEYRHFLAEPEWLKTRLSRLAPLHSHATVAGWIALVDAGDWDNLVTDLLATHYDAAYLRSTRTNYPGMADAPVLRAACLSDAGLEISARALLDPAICASRA